MGLTGIGLLYCAMELPVPMVKAFPPIAIFITFAGADRRARHQGEVASEHVQDARMNQRGGLLPDEVSRMEEARARPGLC